MEELLKIFQLSKELNQIWIKEIKEIKANGNFSYSFFWNIFLKTVYFELGI